MRTYSLTRRLILAIVLVELCSALALVVCAGVYERYAQFRAFDVMLRGRADSMLGAVQDAEDPQDNVMLDGTQAFAPKRDIYAVRDELGRLLGHSANWPDAEAAFRSRAELRSLQVEGHRYRVVRVEGLRMVDPGDKGGGITRHVVVLYGARSDVIWQNIGRAVFFYGLLSVALLGVSVWLMLRVLRHGLQPLTELAQEAGKVSVASWSFEPSERVRAVGELGPLISAITLVLEGLERSFDQQRHFVSDAAHELKTSVAVVKSSLQVLTMKERSVEEYRTGLKRAEDDCQRMEELVASMLMLAGVEAGTEAAHRGEAVEVGELMTEVCEQFGTTAAVRGVGIRAEIGGQVWVLGEREKLRVLLSNVLDNALQHSAHGAEVRALLGGSRGMAELCIEDDGEGIAAETLPFVFDRFYRGDVSRSRRTGGTGLGLAICRAIVQGMGGTISLQSEVDCGTRVLVSLPAVEVLELVQGEGAPTAERLSASLKVGPA